MLKKIISVLTVSIILVSLFSVFAYADEVTYPYSDTSVIPVSREDFLTLYAPQLGITADGSTIPEDDYIYLVRNELGDYGDLYRSGALGRVLRGYQLSIIFGNDVVLDAETTEAVGFLSNPMNLSLNKQISNEIRAWESFDANKDMYPTYGSTSEPIVTEFFIFSKNENFSAVTSVTTNIITLKKFNKYTSETYTSIMTSNVMPHYILVDGVPGNSLTFGEGGNTHKVSFVDNEENVLWETFVPDGAKVPKIYLNHETKSVPGYIYTFKDWKGFDYQPVFEDVVYTAIYDTISDPRGDINGDGAINNKDAVKLLKELKYSPQSLTMESADVNGDGTMDYSDVIYLLEFFAEARKW